MRLCRIQVGDRFGRLVVSQDLGLFYDGRQNSRRFACACDCGGTYEGWARGLLGGGVTSCGCLRYLPRLGEEALLREVIRSYKGNARSRSLTFNLTREQMILLFAEPCYYCGSPPTTSAKVRTANKSEFIYNGIDRVDNARGYEPGNVVACCKMCNLAKKDLSEKEFLDWVGRVHAYRLDPYRRLLKAV
jgi:hypothetical protein